MKAVQSKDCFKFLSVARYIAIMFRKQTWRTIKMKALRFLATVRDHEDVFANNVFDLGLTHLINGIWNRHAGLQANQATSTETVTSPTTTGRKVNRLASLSSAMAVFVCVLIIANCMPSLPGKGNLYQELMTSWSSWTEIVISHVSILLRDVSRWRSCKARDRAKTEFVTPQGQLEWSVMPYGLI